MSREFLHWCESVHLVVATPMPSLVEAKGRKEGFQKRARAAVGHEVLEEELKASRAEVAHLRALLRGNDAQSSVVVEYLQSDVFRHQMEFKRAHYSQHRYVRASSDVATLLLGIDLSPLYRAPSFLEFTTELAPMWSSSRRVSNGGL
ncbi:hypothetical protein ACLOJK_034915 [Asimina triloba]